jgi:hypothetical protein
MKRFFLVLVVAILAASAALAQTSGTRLNFPAAPNGSGGITAVFLNTTVAPIPTPGSWITVDVTTLGLPSNTVAIDLGGFLIITNGSNTGTSNLTIALRPFGDLAISCGNYIGQTIAPNPPSGNGVRQLMNAWVSLNGGKFEYCWQRGIVGTSFPTNPLQTWPADPAFAINLNIEASVTP